MSDIPEDITTQEQLRRCRELLASNLCAQGVRALPTELLPQLIAKVSKIDRQQRHVDTLWNYVNQLKNFAVNNAQDFAIAYYSSSIGPVSSMSSSNGANWSSADVFFTIPTTLTADGVTFTVDRSNVILISGELWVYWGSTASNYSSHRYFPHLTASALKARTFAQLKSQAGYYMPGYYGTVSSTIYFNYSGIIRYSDVYYRCTTYPYSSSYDYWCGNSNSSLINTVWAFKLPQLGVAPNNLFPAAPVIPKQEFYY
jgi:hypothetical protein